MPSFEYQDSGGDSLVVQHFDRSDEVIITTHPHGVSLTVAARKELAEFLLQAVPKGTLQPEQIGHLVIDEPPAHYRGKSLEPWDIWEAFNLDPWQANVIKYVLRAARKKNESAVSDYTKAVAYLRYLIKRG